MASSPEQVLMHQAVVAQKVNAVLSGFCSAWPTTACTRSSVPGCLPTGHSLELCISAAQPKYLASEYSQLPCISHTHTRVRTHAHTHTRTRSKEHTDKGIRRVDAAWTEGPGEEGSTVSGADGPRDLKRISDMNAGSPSATRDVAEMRKGF